MDNETASCSRKTDGKLSLACAFECGWTLRPKTRGLGYVGGPAVNVRPCESSCGCYASTGVADEVSTFRLHHGAISRAKDEQ
jgi:hypothetical protein